MSRSRTALAALASLALVLTAACGGGGGEEALPAVGQPVPTPTSAAPTTAAAPATTAFMASPPAFDQKVIDLGPTTITMNYPADATPSSDDALGQYLRFHATLARSFLTPNPADAEIRAVLTDAGASHLLEHAYQLLTTGQRSTGGPLTLNPTIISATESVVQIEDCMLDATTLVDGRGQIISPPNAVNEIYVVEMLNVSGTWKVDVSYGTNETCQP